MAKPHRRAWWFAQVAKLPSTGLTHNQFAAELGVSVAALRHWIYAERRDRRREQVPALVEVRWQPPTVAAPAGAPVRIVVGCIELVVEPGTEPAWLAELLTRLDREVAPC